MRVALAAGVLASFALLPHFLRSSLLAQGSPRFLLWFGLTSLLGIAAGLFALLSAMVAPGPLPIADLPRAVEVCIDAAGRLFSHPLAHWPSILAAAVLLAALGRFLVVAALTVRDARRARPPLTRFPGEEESLRRHLGTLPASVRLLPCDSPIAYTTGLIRPVTVVSDGLLEALDLEEREAVVAHERAHAALHHTIALSIARIMARAFGFVPGVGISVDLLVTALEAKADEKAVRHIGEPLVVAQALAATARLVVQRRAAVAGIADGEISYRIRRLTAQRLGGPRRTLALALAIVTVAAVAAQGVAWSAGQRALVHERLALTLHDTCHQPHETAKV